MDKLMIVGGNTIAGANIAASVADRFEVIVQGDTDSIAAQLQQAIRFQRPDWVVFCGQASRSAWDIGSGTDFISDDLAIACGQVCDQLGAAFTMISSDAIFTGPWMSHDEESTQFCESAQAKTLIETETQLLELCPKAMLVRANIFGCSPQSETKGFAESMIETLTGKSEFAFDVVRHACPILATDLADLLVDCFSEELEGVLHLGTAERTNPFQFATELAHALGLPLPKFPNEQPNNEMTQGFGRSETTMNCALASELLDCKMPLLSDSLIRFGIQVRNGYRNQLCNTAREVSRVA